MDALINDAASLVAEQDVDGMISFFISRLLDRFIPTHTVFLIEPPRGGLLSQYVYRQLRPAPEERFPEGCWPALKGIFASKPWMLSWDDIRSLPDGPVFGADFLAYEPELFLPMHGIGGLYGLAILGAKLVGGSYSPLERMYLDRMTRFLSIGAQNSLHHNDAITDAKTGLYNHAHFMARMEEELARVRRGHGRAGMLMLDIDHFKDFNDRHGHLAGDEILKALSRELRRQIRSEDVGARFGGEEFTILAIDCDESRLLDLAERLRTSISLLRVPWKEGFLSITVSLGLCAIDSVGRLRASDFVERADRALYRSKASGRNRSSLWRSGLLGAACEFRGRQAALLGKA